jgi:catecholate siderophore receptor
MQRLLCAQGRTSLLSIFALVLVAVPAAAQAKQRLELIVTDATGALVPAAGVVVRAPGASKPAARGMSDGAGEFDARIAPGVYLVKLTHAGFANLEQQLAFTSGETLTLVLTEAASTESIVVRADNLRAVTAASATRMPMAILETPQQVQVLTGELLRSRSVDSMKQAMEMSPAVGLQLGEGRRDNFFIRGFNAVGDMYIDGVRDDAQYYRDLSNTERIEVVEGPAAVLYGRGSSGGLINRVTKKPSMEGTMAELTYTAGGYGEQRGAADLDTIVPESDGKLGLRLTGAAEHEGSQRHDYWEDRYTFAPTLLWKPSEATTLSAQVERLRDDRLPDRGIPYLPATGAPAAVPVGTFYGYVGPAAGSNFIHSAVTDGTFDARRSSSDGWNWHVVQRLAGYNTVFTNVYPSAVTGTSGAYMVARGEYNGIQLWTNADSNVEGYRTGRWLGMQHTFLAGLEYGREVTDSTQYNGPTNQTPVSLLNPAPTPPVLSTTLSRNNRFLGQTMAVYAQDLIALTARWRALVGLRIDDFRQTLELRPPTDTTPNLGRTDYAPSPRVGLVYVARPWASVYGNYSRTFDPSGENLSLATNNAELEPEVTQNYEGGAKANLLRDRMSATLSVFRLDRTNIKTTDPNNPLALLSLGEQRTDGAEVNAQGSILRHWQVYGGYAWLDGRIVSSTTLSNGVSLQGRRPAMSPLHASSVWTTYTFEDGLGVGGGLVARAKQFASTDNLAILPAYGRVDLSIFYRRARYELQANVQNVGNIRYCDAAQSDYQIYPAAPINATFTTRWRF